LLAIVALFILGFDHAAANPAGLVSEALVVQDWQRAQQSGAYDFRSNIEQTTYPAPSLANAARPPRPEYLATEGSIDQPGRTMEMSLWQDGSFNPDTAISVRVEDGLALGRRGLGEWQEMDNVANAFAPGGDLLGFLAAVENLQPAGSQTRTDFKIYLPSIIK